MSADPFTRLPTLNVHPSLLPALKGLTALGDAREARVRFIGATLHVVVQQLDSGPIAQAAVPVDPSWSDDRVQELSFVQRLGLILLALELVAEGDLAINPRAGSASIETNLPVSLGWSPALRRGRYRDHIAAGLEARHFPQELLTEVVQGH